MRKNYVNLKLRLLQTMNTSLWFIMKRKLDRTDTVNDVDKDD